MTRSWGNVREFNNKLHDTLQQKKLTSEHFVVGSKGEVDTTVQGTGIKGPHHSLLWPISIPLPHPPHWFLTHATFKESGNMTMSTLHFVSNPSHPNFKTVWCHLNRELVVSSSLFCGVFLWGWAFQSSFFPPQKQTIIYFS